LKAGALAEAAVVTGGIASSLVLPGWMPPLIVGSVFALLRLHTDRRLARVEDRLVHLSIRVGRLDGQHPESPT
jgi:hypothetical protein